MWSVGLPFDQGIRDKIPTVQMDLFDMHDPNLPEEAWYELLDWLTRRDVVYHNAKYDMTMMEAGTRHWPGRRITDNLLWDSMLASRILDPTLPARLGEVATREGFGGKKGIDELRAWLKKRKFPASRYDLVPWSVAEPYVTTDAEMTAQLFARQLQRFRCGEGQRVRMDREIELCRALYMIEHRGLGYDAQRSLDAAEILERRAADLAARLPFEANVDAAKAYFFDQLKLPADRASEKTGEPSLDEEQVRAFVEQRVEWAWEYSLVTRARRAVSMWYRGYPDKIGVDGRLRCDFKQAEVKSGRMSVKRVQLQAMPKSDKYSAIGSDETLPIYEGIPGVRDLLIARPGHGLWNLDLSQAELRVAARYSGCRLMLEELLSDDPDIHGKTCENVLGVSRDDPQWKPKRDIAKRLTFGGIFMIGGRKFQSTLAKLADIHLPLSECEAYVRNWRRMYPEYGVAYRRAERVFSGRGYVRLLPNTEYEMWSWMGPRDYPHTAWNRIVQGSLAEAFKLLLTMIEKNWPGYLILTVHDSVVFEFPLDEGDAISKDIAAAGAKLMTDLFDIEMLMDTDRW